jgi:peptidoglycan/xylan/chitin deacetylase (PgdA/CDA1 family)
MLRDVRKLAAAVGGITATMQVGPAVSWLPPVRRHLLPRLAGLGPSDGIALTFDDGPHPQGTPAVLDRLDELGWRATFFVLGEQARRYPDDVRETVRRGHEIAVHGEAHRYLIARSPPAAVADLRQARDTIWEISETEPLWWRPPYGVLSGPALAAAAAFDLRPLLWTSWGKDWRADATAESVVAELCAGGLPGGTLLLHDSDLTSAPSSWRIAVDALALLGNKVAEAGLSVRPLVHHLR